MGSKLLFSGPPFSLVGGENNIGGANQRVGCHQTTLTTLARRYQEFKLD